MFKAKKIIIPYKYEGIELDDKIQKVKLDTTYIKNQKKQLELFLKKMKARADRGGFKTNMKKQSVELNFDDINY